MLYDPSIDWKSTICDQLQSQNTFSSSLGQITSQYLGTLHRLREVQVRCAQLDKEAGELRQENDHLVSSLEDAQRSAVQSEEYIAAKAQVEKLQQELLEAYKQQSTSSEAAATALRQLEVVREVASSQEIELQEARDESKNLTKHVKQLQEEVEQLKAARDLASKETESRLLENARMAARNLSLEQENADLACRLIELKDAEVERMNEMNKMIEELLANARHTEANIIAQAKKQAGEILAAAKSVVDNNNGGGGGGGHMDAALDAMLSGLNLSGGEPARGKYVLPKIAHKAGVCHVGGCYGAAFDSQGGMLATCGSDKVVKLWDPLTRTQTHTLRGAHEGINSVAFTSDTKLLLGAEEKMAVRGWDIRTSRLVLSLTGHTGKVNDVSCSPVDSSAAVSCSTADRTIKIWDLKTGIASRTILSSACNSVCFNTSGGVVCSGHRNGSVCFWDKRAHTSGGGPAYEIENLHGKCEVTSTIAAMGSLEKILTCGKDNTLRLVDTRTFKVLQRMSARGFSVGGTWLKACLSPAAQYAAAGSTDGTVIIWNTRTGAVESELKSSTTTRNTSTTTTNSPRSPSSPSSGSSGFVTACAWSPTGLPLVSCDKGGSVVFWNNS